MSSRSERRGVLRAKTLSVRAKEREHTRALIEAAARPTFPRFGTKAIRGGRKR